MSYFFIVVYALSLLACVCLFIYGLEHQVIGWETEWRESKRTPSVLVIGIAGFAVFPGLNTVIALTMALWLLIPHKFKESDGQ